MRYDFDLIMGGKTYKAGDYVPPYDPAYGNVTIPIKCGVDFEEMSPAELRKYAAERGIDLPDKRRKDLMISAIKSATEG